MSYAGNAAANKVTQRDPNNAYVVQLESQLAGLRRLEDPSNDSPTAVVYREMLAVAAESRRAEAAVPRWANGQVAEMTPAQVEVRCTGQTHGRIATYNAGCRCDECRAVATEKRRSHRAAARAS